MKVLLVDDNAGDRMLLRRCFERHCYEVAEAADGQAGLEAAGSWKPDLIISDALMPVMDGFQFLRRIRQDEELAAIPFIFYSAVYNAEADEQLALSLGADAFIVKPKEPDQFWAEMESCLRELQAVERRKDRQVTGQEGESLWRYCCITAHKLEEKVGELEAEAALRRKAEGELRESEERYRTLFETSPDAIVLFDLDFHLLRANRAASALFGYESLSEVEDKGILDFGVPDEKEKALQTIKIFLEKGYVQDIEFTAVRKDGTAIPVWIRAALMKDPDGRPHSIIAVFRDLSERKRLEEELIQAQKLESLGTLAGGVAHDFNNIINVINGFASLMRLEMEKDTPFYQYLDKIISAAERATHVTRQLLLFSRKHESEMRLLNINDIILNTEKLLVRFLPEDIRLRFIPSNKELMVMADIAQIDQLLMNLAANARDAMPAGGHLIISTSMAEFDAAFIRGRGFGEPGKYALVSVTDTGTGMDEHTKKRAFDPFFTTKTTGTGLGLPVVYGIVRAHKGYIDLSSEPGQGSTFRIYIPLTEKGAEEQADAGRKTGQAMPQGSAETVLMAEDDPETRRLFSVVLEKLGYRVITAEDGADAVKKFFADRDAVNVLLLDVVMPNMNGREAYEEIRRVRPDIKAIFMSGYRGSFERPLKIPEECGFLSKPVSPNDLAAKIREVLDRTPP